MEARTLLSSTKFTVGEIAAKLGFSDAAGFCKFFKRNAGQTPLNYRKGLLIWTERITELNREYNEFK